jgi:transaldolase
MDLTIKLFADTGSMAEMERYAPMVAGFTTNPSLLRAAGVSHYASFAAEAVRRFPQHCFSFEVVADDLDGMMTEARIIARWGDQVYVKIPVTTTAGESAGPVIRALLEAGINVNVTAVFTTAQVARLAEDLYAQHGHEWRCVQIAGEPPFVSFFAGRVADAGQDAMVYAKAIGRFLPYHWPGDARLIWASTREPYNILQAQEAGCYAVTVSPAILDKLHLFGKDLREYSLETVRQFRRDALAAKLV